MYGGGHAQAGIASIGIKGPGYNGRRIGFDCSGSVAAVLAAAGVWQPTSGVPNDAGIITELLQQHMIARGAGHGATEVTLYDDPGVHIFMDIDGRFFGTSDGGGGGNAAGGAGWLDDGAPDAHGHVYKRYHLLLPELVQRTTFTRILTFQMGSNRGIVHGLALGSDVHVGYTQTPTGRMTAQGVSQFSRRNPSPQRGPARPIRLPSGSGEVGDDEAVRRDRRAHHASSRQTARLGSAPPRRQGPERRTACGARSACRLRRRRESRCRRRW